MPPSFLRSRLLPALALWLATALTPAQASSSGGWQGLARALDTLTPSVDTSIPPSAAQITERISRQLDQGENAQALEAIQARKAALAGRASPGVDVQLLFLEARALSALGRTDEAIDIYQGMTVSYPELPEPWNNLANEYVQRNQLERARDALQMALMANPNYAVAQSNLGAVQLLLARQAFERAAQSGVPGTSERAQDALRALDQP